MTAANHHGHKNGSALPTVLVVDDDLFIRTLIRKILPESCTCIEVSDGALVLDAYKEHSPCIVFLDLHMPNKEAPEILQEIYGVAPDAYVAVISGDSNRENIAACMICGAKSFISKPLEAKRILEEYSKALANSGTHGAKTTN